MIIQEMEMILFFAGAVFLSCLLGALLRWVVNGDTKKQQIKNIAIIASNHGLKKKPLESRKKFQERVFDFIYNRK